MNCTSDLLEIDWNNEMNLVIVPTKSGDMISRSLFQVYRAVGDVLLRPDIEFLFKSILTSLDEVLLTKIKTSLIINKDSGYKLLCDELDFLIENFKELFEGKLAMDITPLQKKVKEIEALKTVFLIS